jgi:hypothetical protein
MQLSSIQTLLSQTHSTNFWSQSTVDLSEIGAAALLPLGLLGISMSLILNAEGYARMPEVPCKYKMYKLIGIDPPEFEELDCTNPASSIVYSIQEEKSYHACEYCAKLIETCNWLHTPEGRAALEEMEGDSDE